MVYEGICPTFSIPQNNLFQKILGQHKEVCFFNFMTSTVYPAYYNASVRSFIFNVLYNPRLLDENIWRCQIECDEELFNASNIL